MNTTTNEITYQAEYSQSFCNNNTYFSVAVNQGSCPPKRFQDGQASLSAIYIGAPNVEQTISGYSNILGVIKGSDIVIFTITGTQPCVGFTHRVSFNAPFVEKNFLFEANYIYETSLYTRGNRYMVVQKELLTITKSFVKIY